VTGPGHYRRTVRWTIHGERDLYDSEWMRLVLVDVEIPGVDRFDHHVVRYPQPASGTVVHDPVRGVLLLWRHRFITDTWGWEIPAGAVDEGETLEEAAARETLEETGWRPGPLRRIGWSYPSTGLMDQRFFYFLADGATFVQEVDSPEVDRVEWKPVDEVRQLVGGEGLCDGLSVSGLALALAKGFA
jgi:8-oxo-dGTP pyrophosphatase MutT (NUDIX family)